MKLLQNKKYLWLAAALLAAIVLICVFTPREKAIGELDYSAPENWAYFGGNANLPADVFFIAPTNVLGDAEYLVTDLNEADRESILAAIGMQTGIYNEMARFYSPYYRQITIAGYECGEEKREQLLASAYEDVRASFLYYLKNENNGRPFVIAGFSQGADHGLRLLKEFGSDADFADRLVAAYLIGWRITQEDLSACPWLKPAQGETDTGVFVSFECEADYVTDSMIVPAGVFTYSINPLNWRTDSTPASKEENLGFVYPDIDGSVKTEIPQLCGAYLSPERGTLIVTDVTAEEYPPILSIFPQGSYHIYDYEFFYRNLQQNVNARIAGFTDAAA